MDMSQRLNTWLAECRQSSSAYKIACLLIVFLHIASGAAVVHLFLEDISKNTTLLLLRLLAEGLTIVAVCHFLMRPFLRLGILRQGLNGASISALLLYALPVAIFMSASMYVIAELTDYTGADIDSVQFVNKDGELSKHNRAESAYVIIAAQQYIFLLFWAALYLSWHFYRKRIELAKELELARLKQLANQINPHFLFNTLNSIRALVYSDKDKAAETITQLSELMRVHMHAEVEALSSLGKEVELAKRYIDIESLRLQDRLRIEWDVDKAAESLMLPSLALLTLVENAVKFGVAPSRLGGDIKVSAKLREGLLQLSVSNTLPDVSVEKGNGIGLKNIQNRLKLLYGENARFAVSNSESFTVLLELPLK